MWGEEQESSVGVLVKKRLELVGDGLHSLRTSDMIVNRVWYYRDDVKIRECQRPLGMSVQLWDQHLIQRIWMKRVR